VFLNELSIGAPSLRNVPEMVGVLIAAIVAAYLKFFYFDRKFGGRPISIVLAFAIVGVVTIVFRLFTPQL
jgi:H+/Cl- antiporter ClcA